MRNYKVIIDYKDGYNQVYYMNKSCVDCIIESTDSLLIPIHEHNTFKSKVVYINVDTIECMSIEKVDE